jgi:hypothetical protein
MLQSKIKVQMMIKPCQILEKESTQERERKKKQGARQKRQTNSPKEAIHEGKGTTKNQTLF